MSHSTTSNPWPKQPTTSKPRTPLHLQLAKMMIVGPRRLLTSRITTKCAALMVFLSSPSLVLCAILTIPALIFQNPNQQAYFYFAQLIQTEPGNLVLMPIVALCSLIALMIPAALPEREMDLSF